MSPIDSILGESGWGGAAGQAGAGIHVWARPKRRRATEAYRLEAFEAHERGLSQRKLSVTHQVGSATTERGYQSFIKQRVSALPGRPCPQVLGASSAGWLQNLQARRPRVSVATRRQTDTGGELPSEINPSARACRDFSCGGYARHAQGSHVGRGLVR